MCECNNIGALARVTAVVPHLTRGKVYPAPYPGDTRRYTRETRMLCKRSQGHMACTPDRLWALLRTRTMLCLLVFKAVAAYGCAAVPPQRW